MLSAIAGEVSFNGTPAATAPVEQMLRQLDTVGAHRPRICQHGWLAVGQVLLDGSTSAQHGPEPVFDAEQQIAVVFDGRLFNRDELRTALQSSGVAQTDAELVLAAYQHWGKNFVERLDGHFVIVIADQRHQQVLLYRDRLGVRPLYLTRVNGRLRFASSLPALVASGGVDTSVDKIALHHYMSWHSIVPAPRTLLTGVAKLPPATVQMLDTHDQSEEVYWQPDYARSASHADWDADDWQTAIHQSLQQAVERNIVSQQRTDVLLSGGLDSSLLVAFLAEAGVEDISTFSIGFDSVGDQSGNEFGYAQRVADEFNTDHHTLRIGTSQLYSAVDDAIAAMTEPMASHDVPAFYLNAQAVAGKSAGVQSGQGADEIFAGYRYHRAAEDVSRDEALEPFLEAFQDHDQQELEKIIAPQWLAASNVSRELLDNYVNAPGAQTAVDAVLRLETQLILADDPVKRVTNMSMAAGLEPLLPFLDHEFIELVIASPPELRTDQEGKGLLKNIGRDVLPTEVVDRPKGYFPVPALQHLQDPLYSQIAQALRAPEARERGLFNPEYVESLLAQPNERFVPAGANELWKIGLLEMWLQQHNVG